MTALDTVVITTSSLTVLAAGVDDTGLAVADVVGPGFDLVSESFRLSWTD